MCLRSFSENSARERFVLIRQMCFSCPDGRNRTFAERNARATSCDFSLDVSLLYSFWSVTALKGEGITAMNAVNAVLLFILVWTFTDVCQADDKDISVSCDDVTGSVGKEITFTCSVSLLRNNCCIRNHFFKCEDLKFCELKPYNDSCEKNKIFTCPLTPSTKYRKCSFFVQTTCGWTKPEFTVDITGYSRHKNPENPVGATDVGFKYTVVAVIVSGLIIFIIIIITAVIYKTKPDFTKHSGFKNKMFLVVRHDVDKSDHKKFVI